MSYPVFAITSGEPAGIGPDICLDLPQFQLPARCVVLADIELMRERARLLGKDVQIVPYQVDKLPSGSNTVEVLHIPVAEQVQVGVLNVNNAPYVIDLLDRAHQGIVAGEFAGMVTAPLHKGIINDAGKPFSGHTEYLADISHTPQVVMMLAGGGLRVAADDRRAAADHRHEAGHRRP